MTIGGIFETTIRMPPLVLEGLLKEAQLKPGTIPASKAGALLPIMEATAAPSPAGVVASDVPPSPAGGEADKEDDDATLEYTNSAQLCQSFHLNPKTTI